MGRGTAGLGSTEAINPGPAGGSGRRLRADPEALHIAQPLGAGGTCRSAEHRADQPDAKRPQPRGLRQRAGERKARLVSFGRPGGGGGPEAQAESQAPATLCAPGAGLVGVPLRRPRGAAAGAGLQGDPAAAELTGAVGSLAGRRREPGAQALPGKRRLPQSSQTLPPQVVLLQVRGGSIMCLIFIP